VLGHRDGKVSAKKNALQYLIDKLTHNEDIELYNGGKFYRDYIDVRDCAHAIKLVVEKGTHPVYNISNGTSYLFKDLIEKAKDYSMSTSNVWDKMDVVEFHNQVQVKDIFLSNKKLVELGYSPKYTIEETIREIIDNERA
jgi:nucleoside-diphosphate-sugar epimerase